MLRYDRVLIAPERAELECALIEAARAASKGYRARTITWTPADTLALLQEVGRRPEGFRQWNGPGERKQRGMTSRGETRSAVAVSWWSDPIGRLHFRIGSIRFYAGTRGPEDNLFIPYANRPPLWLTHPESCYFWCANEALIPFVVCSCGTTGRPESVGWMGTRCAACHDRAEDATSPPVPAGHPTQTRLVGHIGCVGPVVISPDGRTLVSADKSGGRIIQWDLPTETSCDLFNSGAVIQALAISPDGETLAVGFGPGRIDCCSIHDRNWRPLLLANPGPWEIVTLTYSPDGAILAVAFGDRIEVLDSSSGTQRAYFAEGVEARCQGRYLAFSPNGEVLVVGTSRNGVLALWTWRTGKVREVNIPGSDVAQNYGVFSPDGETLAVVTSFPTGRVVLVDMASEQIRATIKADRVGDLAFSPDGRVLALICRDEFLRLHAVPDGRCLGVFAWHTGWLNSLAFSPDGQWLATSSNDCSIKIWPVAGLLAAGREIG